MSAYRFPKLALDVGNTATKLAFWQDVNAPIQFLNIANTQDLFALIVQKNVNSLAYCKSGKLDARTETALQEYVPQAISLTHETPIKLQNNYLTPHTLGMDRLAAAIGAASEFPNQSSLIADAGTCLTLDFLENGQIFWGGNISAGLAMRLKSLHQYTAKLPELDLAAMPQPCALIGQSTAQAMYSGAMNGLIYEIEGTYKALQARHGHLALLLCGGNSSLIERCLSVSFIRAENLVLKGLLHLLA
ncbi:MAG: type III pantothenate kinase [Cytophagales bacterium]|nr:MAG: type III pantothenate kinase [Cytophagales bacterium]TAF61511.1 MAG: type III pantothenate kinase [Cytophagales bacterium]